MRCRGNLVLAFCNELTYPRVLKSTAPWMASKVDCLISQVCDFVIQEIGHSICQAVNVLFVELEARYHLRDNDV